MDMETMNDYIGVRSAESIEAAETDGGKKTEVEKPKREWPMKGWNDYVLDLSPLEEVIPFYKSDPRGKFEGKLSHPLVQAMKHLGEKEILFPED